MKFVKFQENTPVILSIWPDLIILGTLTLGKIF